MSDSLYCLVSDDDYHWYVIPVSKIEDADEYFYGERKPQEKPEWLVPVNGSPSRVSFPSYVLK